MIADTDAEAEALAAPAFKVWRDHIGYLTARADRQAPGSGAAADPVVSRVNRDGGLLAGTAKTVAAALADYIEASSINYALVTFSFGDLRAEDAMRSLELFASEVMPAVRAKLEGTPASR